MAFWTYLLQCSDGSFYVGHTEDLEQRIASHHAGSIAGYTAQRRPIRLLWSQDFQTRDEAFAVERQIKGWSRAKKLALVQGDWTRLGQLARGKHRHQREPGR
ncbi:MAG: GIY-YIG nuclease family protein [Chiayiivirga sp.]|jgi:predicted GIY-YIG superfamily endonuclease|uniref:GIY-YIG nuclease family protein n=1 Tax=Chiayiivirga sp. TaxID=2041042 RepID=UPI0025C2DE56|nr:GIY-YIG nuclease family protein [Chiayiivirga sp.]MCI1729180.1 GIY-YIG nuclease family protein [Chiayiivirga sp.]